MKSIGKVAGVAGLAIAGGLAVGMKRAIGDASDLHEQINKADVVFRGSEKVVQKWSKTTASSLGESRREALQMAATFGNMLVPMGYARKEAAGMSMRLVKLSADMASFNNASPEDTLDALQSGLAGQVRPLRQFGVFLSKARIEAEAFTSGIAKPTVNLQRLKVAQIGAELAMKDYQKAVKEHGKGSDQAAAANARWLSKQGLLQKALAGQKQELTAAQKTQATYNIIMRDTADSQGDFARTSGGLANQQRIMRAQFEDVSAQLGMVLLPNVTKVMAVFIRFLNFLAAHRKTTKIIAVGVAVLAAGLLALSVATTVAAVAAAGFWVALTAGLIVAIPAVVAGLVMLYKKSESFRNIVNVAIGVVKALWEVFKLTPLGLVITHFGKVRDVVEDLAKWLKKVVGWAKHAVSWLGKIKAPSIHLPDVNPFGDPADPNFNPTIGGPPSVSPRLYDELAGARAMGLVLTSGYRPGAVTKHGTRSDHSYYPSHAIDVAGPPNRMASFFRWLIGQTDVKQAFYDPLGSIFGGKLSSYREGGHSDHVHVATYDQGGFLQPGWNLAYNGTGAPERVVRDATHGTVVFNFHGPVLGKEQQIVQLFRNAVRAYERNNGRTAFGF